MTTAQVAALAVVPDTASVSVATRRQLRVVLRDAAGHELFGRAVDWSSSDTRLATVDPDGMVEGVAVGTVTIGAAVGDASGVAEIRILPAPAIAASPDTARMTLAGHASAPAVVDVVLSNPGIAAVTGLRATTIDGQGQPVGWLQATLLSASLPAVLRLAGSAGSLNSGTYQARVMVEASAGASPASIPVELTVSPAGPAIALSDSVIAMTALEGGADPQGVSITVTNGGGGTLSGLGASVTYTSGQGTGWLTASLSPSTPPSSLTLTAQTGSLQPGTHVASVLISSATSGVSPRMIAVSFVISAMPRPTIALSATDALFFADAGGADPGSQPVDISNAGGGTLSGLSAAVQYAAGQSTGWLTATLAVTTAPAELTLHARTGSLAPGRYDASVLVSAPNVYNSPQVITAHFQVDAAVVVPPSIGLSVVSIAFTAAAGGPDPQGQTVDVSNRGGGTLSGLSTAVSYPAGQPSGWLAAGLSSTVAPATLTLQATTGSLAAGTWTANVEVRSAGAINSPQTVTVTFIVTPVAVPPAISLSPPTASFTATAGGADPPAAAVTVSNAGGGTLSALAVSVQYAAGQPTGWLNATLAATTAPTTLTLRPVTGSLAPGSYDASVLVSAPSTSNSPQVVTAHFQVDPPVVVPPSIGLSAVSIAFTAAAGGPAPQGQTVDVSNRGGGTLSGLSTAVSYPAGQPSGWLAAGLSSTLAPATLTLQATTGSLAAGTWTANVEVRSAGAINSPQTVTVTFIVTPVAVPPAISLSPPTASFTATAGGADPPAAAVTVSNAGGGTLSALAVSVQYAAGQPTGWLNATLAATSAPTTLTLRPVTGALAAGTYNATVAVTANGAANSPQTIGVTFTVDAGITIPPAPTGLQATTKSRSEIDLKWIDNSMVEDSFVVERSPLLPVAWSSVATLKRNTTSYADKGLLSNTLYWYRVLACNAAGCSTSNVDSATTKR